jgi:hypothetical protein
MSGCLQLVEAQKPAGSLDSVDWCERCSPEFPARGVFLKLEEIAIQPVLRFS